MPRPPAALRLRSRSPRRQVTTNTESTHTDRLSSTASQTYVVGFLRRSQSGGRSVDFGFSRSLQSGGVCRLRGPSGVPVQHFLCLAPSARVSGGLAAVRLPATDGSSSTSRFSGHDGWTQTRSSGVPASRRQSSGAPASPRRSSGVPASPPRAALSRDTASAHFGALASRPASRTQPQPVTSC